MTVIQYDESHHAFEFDIPLVIVGGGACGLVSALAAKEAGLDPLILERDAMPRGSTFMSSGFVPAAGTRFQQMAGIDDTPDLMADDIQRKNGHEADPEIVRALAEQSGQIIEWLADRHGIPFELVQGFLYPGHSRMRMHCTPRRTGEELMGSLLRAVEDAGIDLMTQAQVKDLFVDAQRRIRGLTYQRPDGGQESVGCEVLLLACNGYGGNAELIRQHLPQMQHAIYYGHEGNQGDAVLWGEALGASLKDLTAFQGHGSLADPGQTLISWALMMQGGIQVNLNGERFSNEHGGYSEQAAYVIAQPEQHVWNIYDGRIHQHALQFEDYRNAEAAGLVKQFESSESLADGLGLPDGALQATLEEMTALALSGEADRFGRTFRAEQLILPPFYAIKVTGAVFHTQGGLEIDSHGRVLDMDNQPLPNLLAAGGAARGVSGSGDSGYLSGNGLLSAVVMGAVAGRTAAQQIEF